jgi:hypothetical protein
MKKERPKERIYPTRDIALVDQVDYVDTFYDRTRRYSYVDGPAPSSTRLSIRVVDVARVRENAIRFSTNDW